MKGLNHSIRTDREEYERVLRDMRLDAHYASPEGEPYNPCDRCPMKEVYWDLSYDPCRDCRLPEENQKWEPYPHAWEQEFIHTVPPERSTAPMKATLTFDLDDPDDRQAHLRCVSVDRVMMALDEWLRWSRSQLKHAEQPADLETARDKMFACLAEEGINLDDLWS